MTDETVTSSNIAARLGISQTAVNKMISKAADFPAPVIDRPNFRAWRKSDIEAWVRDHRPDSTER